MHDQIAAGHNVEFAVGDRQVKDASLPKAGPRFVLPGLGRFLEIEREIVDADVLKRRRHSLLEGPQIMSGAAAGVENELIRPNPFYEHPLAAGPNQFMHGFDD